MKKRPPIKYTYDPKTDTVTMARDVFVASIYAREEKKGD